jgi:uncharacterized protein YbjT (DUF2867 family)
VTGATGETARYTTDLLLDEGFAVRAFVHKTDERSDKLEARGAEIFVGDLLELDDVRSALEDMNAAYFVYPIRPGLIDATAYFAQAARTPASMASSICRRFQRATSRRATQRATTGSPSGYSIGRGSQ